MSALPSRRETRNVVEQVWNWLPVFRVVAELESISRAAEALDVTAPAVSRMIRKLEDTVGQPLFERCAHRITLNQRGKVLLDHVTQAMSNTVEGLDKVLGLA